MNQEQRLHRASYSRYELHVKLILGFTHIYHFPNNHTRWSRYRMIKFIHNKHADLLASHPYDIYHIIKAEPTEEPYRIDNSQYVRPVVSVNHEGNMVRRYASYRKARSEADFDIAKVLYGKRYTAGGLLWMFEDEYVNFTKEELIDKAKRAGLPKQPKKKKLI